MRATEEKLRLGSGTFIMHIPDGYLSPSTCVTLYAASSPFWYAALRKVRRALQTRVVPLLAVFSAFSFVIMMFNLPLPGGTTGHAVGMAIAAIVLGPWFALLSISTALLIQALLFGDGGVTTYGANCFNMAIVGSFASYAVYRLLACGAALTSRRRVIAAGVAGYGAINLAALAAAVEFGVQPLWFHTASGVPLYAPYPLHIAVPAMLLGHLTFAGLAEFVLSAGLVAYLQRTDISLLRRTAPGVDEGESAARKLDSIISGEPRVSRKLWPVLGLFLVLTPLGILAAGGAWGEWRAQQFATPASRAAIAESSGGSAPPRQTPAGLARLSKLWAAPFPDYAPSAIRSAGFGYFISAVFGTGVIILFASAAAWFFARFPKSTRLRPGYVEKTIGTLLRLSEEALFAETFAQRNGRLQQTDPRVKFVTLACWISAVLAAHRLAIVALLFALSVVVALGSRLPLRLVGRVWMGVLVFTGLIALPAIFLTGGRTLAVIPLLAWPVTSEGITAAALLLLRAETAATLLSILALTTRWNRLLRALRVLRLPTAVVIILQMTYRYLFVFLQSAQQMFEARRTRLLAPSNEAGQRAVASSIAGALLERSFLLSHDVHLAMQARGFRGEIRLYEDLAMTRNDWLELLTAATMSAVAIWLGR